MVWNRLEKYRKINGYSQETLAKCVGVSRQTIISIEKGKYCPSLELAFRLSSVFKTTIDSIFTCHGTFDGGIFPSKYLTNLNNEQIIDIDNHCLDEEDWV